MSHKTPSKSTPLMLAILMLMAPLAAANVTTFANGNTSTDIDVRNGDTLVNLVDGMINLPDGETVTSASMDVSTNMVSHGSHSRIDLETMPRVWNPGQNNQLTAFSNIDNFEIQIGNDATPVSLKEEGFLTDFEGSPSGFMVDTDFAIPQSNSMWEHGSLSVNDMPAGCASVVECWGTNMADNNYTDDNNGASFKLGLRSPSLYVDPLLKSTTATFNSWHSFETIAGSGQNQQRYPDCGYMQIRTSPDGAFPPDATGFQFLPFDNQNSSISYGSGYANAAGGSSNWDNQIATSCGISTGQGGLAGTSVTPTNPNGWGTMAIDLRDYTAQYIQIRFIMSHTANPALSTSSNESGWYIDNFRLGDLLSQNESMTVRNLLPASLGGQNHPNGYGLLTIEAETTSSAVLSVDVLNNTNAIIHDRHGELMEGLTGDIIELWDIDSTEHRSVNLRFNFNSGPARLSSPILHGFSMGSRVGTGFNASADMGPMQVDNGVWSTLGGGMPMMYEPMVEQQGFSPVIARSKFSYPITAVTPVIQDDCSESPSISIMPSGTLDQVNLTAGTKSVLTTPIFGFASNVAYQNACNVGGVWFDLEFGHHAESLRIDVANDGDIDYGITDPALDMFGRQTKFILNTVDNVTYGTDEASLTLGVNGQAQGAFFLLPVGATVHAADVSFDRISVRSNSDPSEGFALMLEAETQSEPLGDMPNSTSIVQEMLQSRLPFTTALNNLLTNPTVQGTFEDDFGRSWVKFRFSVDSPNASVGTTLTAVHLDIVYDYTTTLDSTDGLDIELNQGVALWNGGAVAEVPIAVHTNSGGSVTFENLNVATATGYTNTISMTGNPVGLYPNGEIYEVVTTHAVAANAGSTLSQAWLTFETPNDYIKLTWSEFMSFAEDVDPDNHITLEATSSVTDVGDSKQVTWQFRVNPTWDDTETVRIYAGLTTTSGVNGLPDAVLLDPSMGNAVENDAGLTMFQLQNSIGVQQPLTGAESGQDITIIGQMRLEDLAEAPDPSAYFLVLELRHINNTNGNITTEWEEVANRSGVIGGNINWSIDLGSAAGSETYRFAVRGYDGGDLICPPAQYNPDESCGIPFDISIDTYEPNLLDIQVLSPGTDRNVDENWRTLLDDTWVVPQTVQEIRMSSQDLPNPPSSLDLHLWVEHDHDANDDGIADAGEYITVSMASDGASPTANYSGAYNDYANEGLRGKVSMWIEGYDNAGNSIDGGGPGFGNDEITYVSMTSRSPVIRNFNIEDSQGNPFLNANEQQWDGTWNQTMYAGNVYHLMTEASDDNGWRDVDFFKLNLDKTTDDKVVYYFPRNETAWTDSPYLSIVDTQDVGPTMLATDGTALIDPFEGDFIVDIPIQINWGIVGLDNTDIEPRLQMQDLDNPLYTMLPVQGRHIQIWRYSDGIQLDFRTDPTNDLMVMPMFEDVDDPVTSDVREGFVYAGDTIRFHGQYAFREGMSDSVFINPEVELQMEIVRAPASGDPSRGYSQYPGETVVMNFTGGVFDFNLTAPIFTNEYSYTYRLINLPTGAEDFTSSRCAQTNDYGCGAFTIKVDLSPPTVKANTWSTQKGILPESSDDRFNVGELSTANYHCVDVNVQITEREAMFPGDLLVNWMFYQDNSATPAITWNEYDRWFAGPGQATLDLTTTGDGYAASATCLDLWPISGDITEPRAEQMNDIELVFWVSGADSAGSAVVGGGGPQEDGSVIGIASDEAKRRSLYTFINEEATFEIVDVLTKDNPRVGEEMRLRIKVRNDGTMAGVADLVVKSVVNDGIPIVEAQFQTAELGVGEVSDWINIDLEAFTQQTTGMYYTISLNSSGEVLYNGGPSSVGGEGDAFNVKVALEEDSSSFLLIVILLVGVIAVLATVVIVLARRGGDSSSMFDDEYEHEMEAQSPAKQLAQIPSDVTPQMAEAMEAFPDWTQDQIQGYFDQGWDIQALTDWRNEQ